jgi:hypothetical protein
MKKITYTLIIFFIFSSCGYTPIYSSKNSNFYIEKIKISQNDKLNRKIKKNLETFSNVDSTNIIVITSKAKRTTTIITKDKKGDASRYEMKIVMDINLIYNNKEINEKKFIASFGYKTDSNKFNLNQYEKEIENILINKIIDDCIIYLAETINDN